MKKFLTAIVLCSLLISAPASAFSMNSLFDFFSKNGIYYYTPNDLLDCLPGIGSYDGIASAGLTGLRAAFVDTYQNIASTLGAQYGIPWEAVMAQGILESASGTSRFATERNNFFGIGAVDSNPDNAHYFSSASEGWKGYYDFIKDNSRYAAHGAFNHAGDPIGYIEAVKSAGYATDPNYVSKLVPIIKAIQNRSSEKGWASSSETASSSGSLTSSIYDICTAITGGNGDLNATALALSWGDRSHSLYDPNDAYKNALAAVGLSNYSDAFAKIGASCDAFVATVLRYSGVDPNVPCCGAANMLNYFASHPEKYIEVPNIGSSANLQPGDIRASAKHVEMYVVDESGSGRIASASHGDRTADHGIGYYTNNSMRIFRPRN